MMTRTSLFGAFVFLQFTVLGIANHAGEGYLTASQRDLVYYALQVFVILGYLLHSLLTRSFTEKRIRKVAEYVVFVTFPVCAAIMMAAGTDSLLNVFASMIAVLCISRIGGAVHFRMSQETVTRTDTARCMGIGSAAAVILQYLLQIRRGVVPLLPVFMAAAFFLLVYLLLRQGPESIMSGAGKTEKTSLRRIVFSVLIAAAFILFVSFYNETIHHLMIRSNYASANVYSWPRLMMVPGYLLFALIGDRKNGRYMPAASLCIMLAALLNVVLTGEKNAYWFNMCLFYFSIAAFTSYYLLTFWRLAPGTEHPALWAPFGRMLDSSMVLFAGATHLSSLPVPVVLGMDIAGVAVVILMMAFNGDFNLTGTGADDPALFSGTTSAEAELRAVPGAAVPSPMLSPEETLVRMREVYHLTPRETEVLRELVMTEDKQTVISARLSIQVRTLQNYVTQLYRKTGTSTRAGLTDLYYEKRRPDFNPD